MRKFLNWLYRGKLDDKHHGTLLTQYILGDRYLIPQLKHAATGAIVGGRTIPTYATVTRAFQELPESSPMCELMAQKYVEFFDPEDDDVVEGEIAARKDLPQAYLLKLFIGYAEKLADMRGRRGR